LSDELSKIPIKITIVDVGTARGYLNRLTAPLTVETIQQMLTINSRTSPGMGHVSVLLGELEEELPGWEIQVGPREAVDIPAYLKSWE